MDEHESKISNIEWGLVIGVLFTIDIAQILIEWLMIWIAGASIVINLIIDVVVGFSFALYLRLRGESLANPKRLIGLLATFGLEMFPLVSELPLWGLDGIYNMMISNSDKIIKHSAIASNVVKFAPRVIGKVAKNTTVVGRVASFVPKAKRAQNIVNRDNERDFDKAA